MTNTIPHDHHHRLRPRLQEMDQLQALAPVKPPQAKRQARRRTHTSRPYQERLLNMAEARREIVTALKIHRASSTSTRPQYQHRDLPPRRPPSAHAQQLQQRQEEEQQQVQVVAFHDHDPRQSQAAVHEEASLPQTTMRMSYAAAFANNHNPLCGSPPAAHWIAAGGSSYWSPPPILRLPCDLTPPELLTTLPTAAMGGSGLVELEHYQGGCLEHLVRSLPAQPLGLNLSFQGFGVSVDDGAKDDCEDLLGSLPLIQPSPAASYSSYSPPAVETTAAAHACGHGSPSSPALSATDAEKHSVIDAPPAAALVPVLLDGGEMMMAEQASTGGAMQGVDQWSEAAAADVAAWWSKIFESGQRAPPTPNAEDVAAAGLPAEWRWLCADDDVGAAEQEAVTGDVLATTMLVDDGEDVTLPCMDGFGDDVQGWDDGEWFSCS